MPSSSIKEINPIQLVFSDISKILEFIEFKDKIKAKENETDESIKLAEIYLAAKIENDNYLRYHNWWTKEMFLEIIPTARLQDIMHFMQEPYSVPLNFQEELLIKGREKFLETFEEQNNYYRTLMGLPPYNESKSNYIYLSEELQNEYQVGNVPVHELSEMIQNNYMNTDEYKQVLEDNPDKEYLKYLGYYKIDLFTARKAKDFEIIRYPKNRSDINPNLLKVFAQLYDNYREYVVVALYNERLEDVYSNYRTFMKLLIQTFVLLHINNKCIEASIDHNYLDDTVIYTLLSMYGINENLLLSKETKRKLATHIRQLIEKKATSDVYYELINILGYQDVTINKLLLMKGQDFKDGKALDTNTPYFLKVDIKDDDLYKTIKNGNYAIYPYHDIIDNDPTWWNLSDVQEIINKSEYTISDSKYITIDATIHQMQYMLESIFFIRMILDNKYSTNDFKIQIPELFQEDISIFDIIIFIISATCMANSLSGEILHSDFIYGYYHNNKFYTSDEYVKLCIKDIMKFYVDIPSGEIYKYNNSDDTFFTVTNIVQQDQLLAMSGFNFDLNIPDLLEYIDNSEYLEKEKLLSFITNLTMEDIHDIGRIYNLVIIPLREWLEKKIVKAVDRKEYIEYENIYRALFTYDATKNTFYNEHEMPLEIIRKKYNLTDDELLAFQYFYPHNLDNTAVTTDTNGVIHDTNDRYSFPFLKYNNEIDWFIRVTVNTPYGEDDRGFVYFYDILNSDNIQLLTNTNGNRIFMDYIDEEVGWEVNQLAVDKAIELINNLPENGLHDAYFQVYTPIPNSKGKEFLQNEKLPSILRVGNTYKNILIDKIKMDMNGLSEPPKTYTEYLYRQNTNLYDLLVKDDRFRYNKEAWLNDISIIINHLEVELGLQLKYFEQYALGEELFFKPLITLIKRFKSNLINIARTGLKYVFDDKIDTGGNSNIIQLFDEVSFITHFITLGNEDSSSLLELYDSLLSTIRKLIIHDKSSQIIQNINGIKVIKRDDSCGSLRLVDEMKFFKNGENIDPDGQSSYWNVDEETIGRWEDYKNFEMRNYKDRIKIKN